MGVILMMMVVGRKAVGAGRLSWIGPRRCVCVGGRYMGERKMGQTNVKGEREQGKIRGVGMRSASYQIQQISPYSLASLAKFHQEGCTEGAMDRG